MVTDSRTRTDDHLIAVLGETNGWTVNGPLGEVLTMAASLGHAIEKAMDLTAARKTVTTIALRPTEGIVVPREQIQRLAAFLALPDK